MLVSIEPDTDICDQCERKKTLQFAVKDGWRTKWICKRCGMKRQQPDRMEVSTCGIPKMGKARIATRNQYR